MMKVGQAWKGKTTEDVEYINIVINELVLPLTLDATKEITLWEIPENQRKSPKAPHYELVLKASSRK